MLEELELFNKINKAEYYLNRLQKKNNNEYLKLNGLALRQEMSINEEHFIFLCSYVHNPKIIAYVITNLGSEITNMMSDLEVTIARLGNKEKYREWIDFLEHPNIILEDGGFDIDNLSKLNFLVLEAARRGPAISPEVNNKTLLRNHNILKVATVNSIINDNMTNTYKINFNYEDVEKRDKLKQKIQYYNANIK